MKANLGVNSKDAGRLAEGMPLLEEAYRASRRHPTLKWVGGPLQDAYIRAGRVDDAIALIKERIEEARTTMPADDPQLAGLMASAGLTLLQTKAWTEAEPILRECLKIRELKKPDAWSTFNTKSMLGGALLGQQKYPEAEPLLRAGYEGMKEQADKIPPQAKVRLGEALDRLIALAEATGKPDEAKAWRDERAKLPVAAKAEPKRP